MKIIIDTDVCNVNGYSIPEVLFLTSLYYNYQINDAIITKLHNLGLIKKEDVNLESDFSSFKECSLTINGSNAIQAILYNSNKTSQKGKTSKDNIYIKYLEIARAMQAEFPEGKKPGTSLKWKSADVEVASKLMKLQNKLDTVYTKEDYVNAAKNYVKSFNGIYNYMQVLMYFVSKRVNVGGEFEDRSQLLAYLQNSNQKDLNNNWTSTLK